MNNRSIVGLSIVEPFVFSPFAILTLRIQDRGKAQHLENESNGLIHCDCDVQDFLKLLLSIDHSPQSSLRTNVVIVGMVSYCITFLCVEGLRYQAPDFAKNQLLYTL